MRITATAVQQQTQQQPQVKGGVVAYLEVDGAFKAAEFYQRVFGAEIAGSHLPGGKGRTTHMHRHISGSSLMLSDPFPEYGFPHREPQGFKITLQTSDIDFWFKRAVEAGCEVVKPVELMFWGDRCAHVRDAFGIIWAINERVPA